jgi:c-di-GMP-binding flagellar brake protein YcgR
LILLSADMSEELPGINETVEILIEDGGENTSVSGQIYDMSQGLIQLFWPTRSGVRVPVARDRRITIVYHRESGVYFCPGVVAEIVHTPVPIVHLRMNGKIDRLQRREYVRVKTSIPVSMQEAKPTRTAWNHAESRSLHIAARTVDLSGGGIAILKELSVPVGTEFQIKLRLEEGEPPMDLTARIVSIRQTEDSNGRHLFRLGIAFTGIPDAKRKIIVRKVFKIQQELARTSENAKDAPHYEVKK